MNRKSRQNSLTFKDEILHVINGAGDVLRTLIDSVSHLVQHSVKRGSQLGVSIIDASVEVIAAGIHASIELGYDLGEAARAVVIGTMRGVKDMTAESVDFVRDTVSCIVKSTYAAAGDAAAAAQGAVKGAIDGAKELGLDVEEAASQAATGAVKAAFEISAELGSKVRDAVTGTISGIKVVLKEPFKPEK